MVTERLGETIKGETILFSEDTAYVDCTFEGCSYKFDGTAINTINCRFGPGSWEFSDAAGVTLDTIGAFWVSPGSEALLERLFTRMTGSEDTARKIVALKSAG